MTFAPLQLCLCLLIADAAPQAPSEAELATRVPEAIDRGRAELLRRMDGLLKNTASDYPIGRLALPTAALLKSGVAPTEPQIVAALSKLETLKLEKTYCVACYLLLLDALARARNDDSGVRAKMRELVDWLVAAQVPHQGGWTYEKPAKRDTHDFSNVQFAALGLQIGLEHGIAVPSQALSDLASLFVGALTVEGESAPASVSGEQPLEARLGLTRVSPERKFRAAPGGWGYTDPRKGKADRDKPYPSMTAGGVSSLAIALGALRSGKSATQPATRKLVTDGERALDSAYAWIANHFGDFIGEGRELYYTLYSLEKAGDLCKLERFGAHAWYTEGASKLLERQRPNGGWGTYVETSLALLFLTRATKRIETAAPPPILTGGSAKASASNRDLVFIESAKGFLSAAALFKYVGATRKPELVTVCEEIVRHYAPDWRDELVPQLLELWTEGDRVTAFARKALGEITGIERANRDAFVAWEKERGRVLEIESKADLDPLALSRAIQETRSPRLKARLASLAQRRNWRGLAGLLVGELATPSMEYRKRLHAILTLWSSSAVATPARDTPAAWDATVKAWRDWWTLHAAGWEPHP